MDNSKTKPSFLYGHLIPEGSLCFLSGGTGYGTSTLAHTIAHRITGARPHIEGHDLKMKMNISPNEYEVILLDYSHTTSEFCAFFRDETPRNVGDEGHHATEYARGLRLFTSTMLETHFKGRTTEDKVIQCIQQTLLVQYPPKKVVFIIDNYTMIVEDTYKDLRLLNALARLRKSHNEKTNTLPVTMIILAHHKKWTDGKPLDKKAIYGSAKIATTASEIYAIGKAISTKHHETHVGYYLKVVKSSERTKSRGEVFLFSITKWNPLQNRENYRHCQFVHEIGDDGRTYPKVVKESLLLEEEYQE